MASAPDESDDKRVKRRVDVGIPVDFDHAGEIGRGLITNVSNGGALIEHPSIQVPPGGAVAMQLRLGGSRIAAHGRVVRTVGTGFGVHFDSADSRLEELLEIAISRFGPESDEIED
jgi:hypothetical protein